MQLLEIKIFFFMEEHQILLEIGSNMIDESVSIISTNKTVLPQSAFSLQLVKMFSPSS